MAGPPAKRSKLSVLCGAGSSSHAAHTAPYSRLLQLPDHLLQALLQRCLLPRERRSVAQACRALRDCTIATCECLMLADDMAQHVLNDPARPPVSKELGMHCAAPGAAAVASTPPAVAPAWPSRLLSRLPSPISLRVECHRDTLCLFFMSLLAADEDAARTGDSSASPPPWPLPPPLPPPPPLRVLMFARAAASTEPRIAAAIYVCLIRKHVSGGRFDRALELVTAMEALADPAPAPDAASALQQRGYPSVRDALDAVCSESCCAAQAWCAEAAAAFAGKVASPLLAARAWRWLLYVLLQPDLPAALQPRRGPRLELAISGINGIYRRGVGVLQAVSLTCASEVARSIVDAHAARGHTLTGNRGTSCARLLYNLPSISLTVRHATAL